MLPSPAFKKFCISGIEIISLKIQKKILMQPIVGNFIQPNNSVKQALHVDYLQK